MPAQPPFSTLTRRPDAGDGPPLSSPRTRAAAAALRLSTLDDRRGPWLISRYRRVARPSLSLDAFSSREPVSASLENALIIRPETRRRQFHQIVVGIAKVKACSPRGQFIRASIATPLSASRFSHAARSSAAMASAKCSRPAPSCGGISPPGRCSVAPVEPRKNANSTLRGPQSNATSARRATAASVRASPDRSARLARDRRHKSPFRARRRFLAQAQPLLAPSPHIE